MPTYLIPKDNGRLAVFSTVSNRIIADDLTDQEYILGELQAALRQAYRIALDAVREARDPDVECEYDYDFAQAIDEETRGEESAAQEEE
jgi:hypothetical protein